MQALHGERRQVRTLLTQGIRVPPAVRIFPRKTGFFSLTNLLHVGILSLLSSMAFDGKSRIIPVSFF
jgi:hypothetical protein